MVRLASLILACCVTTACASSAPSRPAKPLPTGPIAAFTNADWNRIYAVQPAVTAAARRHRLSPYLINGMIWVESRFKTRARGRRGPRGLMQLMPRTARAMARRLGRRYRPFDASFNIDAGVAYLMLMHERFEALDLALAAYNSGPAAVVRWRRQGRPAPRPRRSYVARVLGATEAFCSRLDTPDPTPSASPYRCPPYTRGTPALAQR